MQVISRPTVIKRLPENVEFRHNITTYGADNLYPQRVEQIALRSPITKSSIKKLAKFLGGGGFEENGDLIVNRFDQTLNDILRMIRTDKAGFDGWSLHFNVNELLMITEIIPMKFKNVRFGLPDDWGRHKDVKVNINWENDFMKSIRKTEVIQTFPLWHPWPFRQEKQNVINDLHELTGPNNAGAVYFLEVPVDFDGQLIEQIPANNSDRLFELTNETSQARIVANYGIPFPILGLQPTAGGVFNQEQLQDSYIYFNTDTREERKSISDAFNKFLQFWHTGAISVGEILEQEFTVKIEDDGRNDNNQD